MYSTKNRKLKKKSKAAPPEKVLYLRRYYRNQFLHNDNGIILKEHA